MACNISNLARHTCIASIDLTNFYKRHSIFPYPLLFDWQRKCHHTQWNKVDLKYLPSSENLIDVYSCIGDKFLLPDLTLKTKRKDIRSKIHNLHIYRLKRAAINTLSSPDLNPASVHDVSGSGCSIQVVLWVKMDAHIDTKMLAFDWLL